MTTLGEALIHLLEAHGVDTVFGIPGVHTVELYRGLAGSKIRHVTPRHEQGAGFMADGYARASGKPGVAFVITGPGLTNTITAMGQARADSVPMLVISGVNATATLGKGFGHLHELPDQRGMMEKVALSSRRITKAEELPAALADAFALFAGGAAGTGPYRDPDRRDDRVGGRPFADACQCQAAGARGRADRQGRRDLPANATRPLILAGGGAKSAEASLQTPCRNARRAGRAHDQCARPAAWPSARRAGEPEPEGGSRADRRSRSGHRRRHRTRPDRLRHVFRRRLRPARKPCPHRHRRRATCAPSDDVAIEADCGAALDALLAALTGNNSQKDSDTGGPRRAAAARTAARDELSPAMQAQLDVVETIRDTLPGSIIVGDSTQPVYAANLYYDHDRPGGWFNAATGFGALGYGPPAAIGAALAMPDATVVCICRRRRLPVHAARAWRGGRSRRAGHLRRLEQSRLPRDRDVDARCRRRAGRRVASPAGFRQDRRSLRHRCRAA